MDPADHTRPVTRRGLLRSGALLSAATLLGVGATGSVAAAAPDFSPRLWGDGEQWGTKVTGTISHPNPHSLDELFVVTNPVTGDLDPGTLPVSEAAPGNPNYNGGRWWTHTAAWTEAGIAAHGSQPPLLTRYGPADDPASIRFHEALGHIEVTAGSPPGGPPPYFRCPLLPVKD